MEYLRFYCEDVGRERVELSSGEARHVAAVRRLGAGDVVELFDGKGIVAKARIVSVSNKKVELDVIERTAASPREIGRIVIAASVAKGERFDWLIAKCTELGIDRVTPVIFERTVKQPRNPKTLQRWRNIAISSAKQCGRIFLPAIDQANALPQVLENLKADYPQARILTGSTSPDAPSVLEQKTTAADTDTIALVGPEGGFTKNEEDILTNIGCKMVRLTNTILRVETAAMAFAALLTVIRDK